MQVEQVSKEQMFLEIERLRQQVETLQQEKADLEVLLETTTDHADTIETLLQESNRQLQAEIIERQRAEAALQSLLAVVSKDKADLEILLDTTTEHGDIIEDLLHDQSIRDPLTGLFNRRYMDKTLKRQILRAQRLSQPLGIIMIDIDRFKRFNNTFGHEAGDIVLREVGLFLLRNIRSSDMACRYGGEEFTVILPEASLADTAAKAEQLRQGVKRLNLEYMQQSLDGITISLGVASFPTQGRTGAEVVQAADAALYQAKARGRDRICIRA